MWSREHPTMPEGAQKWLEWSHLAVGVAAGAHMAALGFFGAGIAFFMMLFSGSVQGIFFFLAAVVLFFVLPSLTLFFFYRAKHSRKGLLIGTLLLLLTITVPAFIRLTIESQNEFSEAIVTASTVVIFGWLGALSLTLITWFKIGSTRKPSF